MTKGQEWYATPVEHGELVVSSVGVRSCDYSDFNERPPTVPRSFQAIWRDPADNRIITTDWRDWSSSYRRTSSSLCDVNLRFIGSSEGST